MVKKNVKGLTAGKDEFSDWFTQIMLKADLADYSSVSGCMVFKPYSLSIWDKVREEVDKRFKKIGIQNVYFPLFIPEKLLNKEKKHVEGFSPEVAWVTHGGNSKLSERLAVRPTSEALMYESYAKWIRSWRDLPLLYNQWNNVVRWEFKHPVPFLRTREFLWNEGHTAYATKKEAEDEGNRIIKIYKEVCERFMALPSLVGRKTEKEKFAGADYTISMEFFMPNGKAIQGPDFHHDGQNFARAYGIKFLDKNGKEEYVWQNTFAISTRMLGVMFAVHSDSKGLVMPPNIAPNKVVVVPILFEDSKKKVLEKSREIYSKLKKFGVILDDREEYKPGFKLNEWDLKGIPLKIEVGPKDIAKKEVVVSVRDLGRKESVKVKDLEKYIGKKLEEMHERMFKKAQRLLFDSIVEVKDLKGIVRVVKEKKIAFAPMCKKLECENLLKSKTGGVKVLNIPDKQPVSLEKSKCVVCGGKGDYFGYIGKSY
jgi:prolyl-tRNA synthetase